ncbi:hypothetical protein LZK98_08825 [Sphingomonas cannabina]|uniref:hypothetical protein n=1 Tax=Sphingomonas cannabina TaxID=2899123 RepID=UPI001F28ADEA|nr:hypothetical protein [Sphingomonas cannabina]UIJ47030.1 hypothetical protein LZK98_08825 [Sphingomonas cannabina]
MLHSAILIAAIATALTVSDPVPATQGAKMLDAATPASAPASVSTSDAQAGSKREQRYCVKQETTGSILTYRKCLTREQWIAKEGFDPLAAKK